MFDGYGNASKMPKWKFPWQNCASNLYIQKTLNEMQNFRLGLRLNFNISYFFFNSSFNEPEWEFYRYDLFSNQQAKHNNRFIVMKNSLVVIMPWISYLNASASMYVIRLFVNLADSIVLEDTILFSSNCSPASVMSRFFIFVTGKSEKK